MDVRLSVCIPTCDRPALLCEAVESCFRQARRPFEILVGDDSRTLESEERLSRIAIPEDVALRYVRNERQLGQSGNVNRLLVRATGSHVALLHDDDLFLPGGLDALLGGLDRYPDALCLYGLQQIIDVTGETLGEQTERWNLRDCRLARLAGRQGRPLQAALWCQPPNDCFLVRAEEARRIGLAGEGLVGHAVDAHFMIELAKGAPRGSFVLIPDMVSNYRLTPNSIARSAAINGREDLFYAWLLADPALRGEAEARDALLRRISAAAAIDAAQAGRKIEALKIILSPYYDMPWLSRWTGFRMISVVSPAVGSLMKRLIDRRLGPHA